MSFIALKYFIKIYFLYKTVVLQKKKYLDIRTFCASIERDTILICHSKMISHIPIWSKEIRNDFYEVFIVRTQVFIYRYSIVYTIGGEPLRHRSTHKKLERPNVSFL